jgi:DNA-directed RNA polymerase specialized sigma24 family protein
MAAEGSPSLFHLHAVDRRGRKIEPAVLEAAEEIYPDALEHGEKLLGDPAVVTNVLEEVAASVSLTAKVKNPLGSPMHGRELRLYLFRAFLNEVNRLKRQEPTFVTLSEVVAVSNPPWADPLRELEAKMLLEEFLALCEPWMQDMAFRRLRGFSWDEIGEAYGVSGHAAQARFSHALRLVRERLKIGKRKAGYSMPD